MTSFDRRQYQTIFNFARLTFYHFQSRDGDLELQACEIMEMCEGVLGQQSTFPPEAREILSGEDE